MPKILHCGYHTPVILAAPSVILTPPSVILAVPSVILTVPSIISTIPSVILTEGKDLFQSGTKPQSSLTVPLRSIPWAQAFSAFRQLALLKQVFSQSENTCTHKRALIDRKGTARDYLNFLLLLTLVYWGDYITLNASGKGALWRVLLALA